MSGSFGPRAAIRASWRLAWFFAAASILCVAWMATDPRTLPSGDPVALKPLKFALSLGLHAATIAAIGVWTRRAAAQDGWFAAGLWIQIAASLLEIAVIALQAARGVESHFNNVTDFDRLAFGLMGLGVIGLNIGFALMLIGLFARPAGPGLARLAAILGVVGLMGGNAAAVMMAQPTADQLTALEAGAQPAAIGSHDVDGRSVGAALPLLGWSVDEGDWRAPHFIRVHALQAIPVLGLLLLGSGVGPPAERRLLWLGAGVYGALFAWSLWRTVEDRSVIAPELALFALAAALISAPALWARLSAARRRAQG